MPNAMGMVDNQPTHTNWTPQYEYTQKSDLTEFIKKLSCPSNDDLSRLLPWKISNDASTRSFLVYIPPSLCRDLITTNNTTNGDESRSWRILLAIHGYGGMPSQEIKKWHDVAIDLHAIIVAPQGTVTASNNRMGWNAIDCCGDPVVNKVDDVGFLNGIINVFVETLFSVQSDNHDGVGTDQVHVIATGFSNGGFLSSLLGLQRQRPWWLVGIVPTGGYQYALKLYGNFDDTAASSQESSQPSSSNPLPLPMMAHHGGKDGVVKPDGCCASPAMESTNIESNCPLDIGINQQTCTSIQTAFEKWSQINGCKSMSMNVGEISTQGGDRGLIEAPYTCWEGNECLASTELCIWTNEGHIWGAQFPGVDLARDWMEKVFLKAESKPAVVSTAEGVMSHFHGKTLVVLFVLLCGFATRKRLSRLYQKIVTPQGLVKRKSSDDGEVSIQLKITSIERDVDDDRGGVNDLERLVIT
ncbi:hypothetical protein HJC23_013015 [Cyclotella cryptica]|uniref:Feruloyl esterase n=1 Tax=Cyclotella cryptica TaxID=29204 RepID=A0ABD3QNI5_9STRA